MSTVAEEQRDRRRFDRAHTQAAGATARARNNASYHPSESHKYKVSQESSSARARREGKAAYCSYLAGLQNDLEQARNHHANAVKHGDYYVGRWRDESKYRQQVTRIRNTTSELRKAYKGIDAHAKAIGRERRAIGCR
jgi:hypothetical protein